MRRVFADSAALRADLALVARLEDRRHDRCASLTSRRPVRDAFGADVAIAAEDHDRGGGSGALGSVLARRRCAAPRRDHRGTSARADGERENEPGQPLVANEDHQISWTTEVVSLTAREFSIEVGGKTFRAATPKVDVQSDPGRPDLPHARGDLARERRRDAPRPLLQGGRSAWWVDEIRVYDGQAKGKWAAPPRASSSRASTGSRLDEATRTSRSGQPPAAVHFAGLNLVSRPFNAVNKPIGGGVELKENARPFAPGGPLRCSGILQLRPVEAEKTLRPRLPRRGGSCDDRPNIGDSNPLLNAPDGVITGTAIGSGRADRVRRRSGRRPFGARRRPSQDCPPPSG